ncbi:FAD-dependent monooxygenase [Massilia sp. H-1]|nr:FAD-dependent monooxygenase [Massilia sp. H-1]
MHPDMFNTNLVYAHMGNHYADGKSPEFNGGSFTHTFILGAFDGGITFYEPMLTKEYLQSEPDQCTPIKQLSRLAEHRLVRDQVLHPLQQEQQAVQRLARRLQIPHRQLSPPLQRKRQWNSSTSSSWAAAYRAPPTATHLARKGYKVLMVEKDTFPRDTNSTHFIWPRGMSYLNRLGVADKILTQTPSFKKLEVSIEGISLHGGVPLQAVKDRFVKLHGDDHGVVDFYSRPAPLLPRQGAARRSAPSGVDVREATTVQSLIVEDGVVVGVRGSGPDGAMLQARAKVVVGADGRMSQFI